MKEEGGDGEQIFRGLEQIGKAAKDSVGGPCMDGAEHAMAGAGRLNGDGGRFRIADFADHEAIRCLAEKSAESLGKAEAAFRINGNLLNAGEAGFNRIFSGKDLVSGPDDGVEQSMEGGGFTGTGGPGDQTKAFLLLEALQEVAGEGLREAEGCEAGDFARMKKAEGECMPVESRNGGEADLQGRLLRLDGGQGERTVSGGSRWEMIAAGGGEAAAQEPISALAGEVG